MFRRWRVGGPCGHRQRSSGQIRASAAARVVWQAVDEQSRWWDVRSGCGAVIADLVQMKWLASPVSGSLALHPEAAVESALGGRPIHGLHRA